MKNLIQNTKALLIILSIASATFALSSCSKKEKKAPVKMSKDFVHSTTLNKVRLGDGIPLAIKLSVRWKIEDYGQFSSQFFSANDYDSLILAPRELELANNVSNTYNNVDTLFNTQRQEFINELKTYLKGNLGEEGVSIKEVIISDITFPANYLASKERLALQEQELKTIRKQSTIDLEKAESNKLQAQADGLVAMKQAEVDANVQKIKAETEKSIRLSRLAKAETEKQVAKMKAEADATRKKLLAKATLEEKTDLKDLEIKRQEEIAQLEFNKDMKMAQLCTDNPAYATYMVNKELASKVQIAVLPNNQDASVFNNLLGSTSTK